MSRGYRCPCGVQVNAGQTHLCSWTRERSALALERIADTMEKLYELAAQSERKV